MQPCQSQVQPLGVHLLHDMSLTVVFSQFHCDAHALPWITSVPFVVELSAGTVQLKQLRASGAVFHRLSRMRQGQALQRWALCQMQRTH